ncbi:MAG: hypothetical protein HKM93_12750 [Desulfobacteraceae bacterium]|nr:hypothetical protein [Desulfobacteraceae bacterium]
MSAYHLIDEPSPGRMARIIVNPLWPLLSYMLGSAVFSWLWYGLNSQALGSSERKKEFALILGGMVVLCAYTLVMHSFHGSREVSEATLSYIRLVFMLISLPISYLLYVLQIPGYEIYIQAGGAQKSGVVGLILAFIFGAHLQTWVMSAILGVTL